MALIVQNACKWDASYKTAYELYLMSSEKIIGRNSDFLQRRIQTKAWTENDCERVKSYLRSLVMGNGTVDFFMIVPLELVIISLKNKMIDTSLDVSEIDNIQSVLNEVEKDQNGGVEFYVVDGQNRLFEALIPFFNNQIPFGQEKIIMIDEDAKSTDPHINLADKYFKDLDLKIQTYLKEEVEVPLAIATDGNINSFTDALIAKNTNIAWCEWQRIRIKNSFTNYNLLVNDVMEDKDEGLVAEKLFSKLGSSYEYDTDGWEKFISEMLIWMKTKKQPDKSSNVGHKDYFVGTPECQINKKSPSKLKKYLREFAKCSFTKKNQHMMVRNYVMFRYAIEHPTQFPTIDIPSWEINMGSEFAAQFTLACEALHKVKGARKTTTIQGKKHTRKVAGFFPWANSEYSKDFIECRLRLLSDYFHKNLSKILLENNTVSPKDTTPMPTVGEMYSEKKYDHKGNFISGLDINRKKFHRGHKKPKRDGGKNTIDNLDFQNVESNLSYGKTEVV